MLLCDMIKETENIENSERMRVGSGSDPNPIGHGYGLQGSIVYLPPASMAQTEKTFSATVLALTLPKPTDVKLEQVKYNAEM